MFIGNGSQIPPSSGGAECCSRNSSRVLHFAPPELLFLGDVPYL